MEFTRVVRRRRMVRNFSDEPVDEAVVERVLRHALHAPSAGFTQGWSFLLLDRPGDVERFWEATTTPRQRDEPDSWLRGMMTAPVIIVPLASKAAYLGRYAEPDKGWTDQDEARWPVPYWYTDTAMASLLMLLTAVDEGLGACFFGVPPEHLASFRDAFGVPDEWSPVGAVALGHRAPDQRSPSLKRGRKPLAEVLHRGRW